VDFVVVDRDEDDAVLAEQVACQEEAWIHHVQPVAVLMPAGIGVQTVIPHNITLIIGDTCFRLITTACLLEVVIVDEIITGIVGRVDIDHLDLAVIRLVQDLQRRQVVALDKHIARRIPIDGIRLVGMERLDSLLLDGSENVALTLPAKPVALTQINRLA